MMDTIKRGGPGHGHLLAMAGLLALLALGSCDSVPDNAPETRIQADIREKDAGTIVALGDSLTSGLGVAPEDSYPAQLERMLGERGLHYRVINAGISGETSSGARARLDWILRLEPAIVIVETGANDGLRGIDPALIENNIDRIVTQLQQEGVTVVLTGMMMMTNLGQTYVTAFNDLYPRLADRHQLVFMPFFLKDVATVAALNQADGIHPNAQGYRLIAANLLPYVEEAIERRNLSGSRRSDRRENGPPEPR